MIAGAVQIHPWLIIFDFLSMPGICPGRTIAIAHAPRLLRDGDDSSLFVGLPEQDVGIFNLAWRGTMRPAVSNTGSECPLLALGANGAAALGGIELRMQNSSIATLSSSWQIRAQSSLITGISEC